MEIWKDVKGYENLYQVSNYGNVKSFNYGKTHIEKVLKPSIKNGYFFVLLKKNNKQTNHYVHRLVAEAFIEHTSENNFVNHKDECRTNNHAENLEWCTQAYNNAYGSRKAKEVAKKSKMVEQLLNGVVIQIWSSTREAQRAGFWSGCIALCCNNKRKTHAGYEWRWVT